MNIKQSSSPFLYFSLVFLLFFLDLAVFSIVEKPLIYSLLCFYLLQLARPTTFTRIIITCFALCLMPLINYGQFGLNLIYLIPATILGIKMQKTLYDARWHYYLLLVACLLVQVVLIEYLILHLTISVSYTLSLLFANLVMIWLMSYSNL